MSDKEIRMECVRIAADRMRGFPDLDHLMREAETIYHFVIGCSRPQLKAMAEPKPTGEDIARLDS